MLNNKKLQLTALIILIIAIPFLVVTYNFRFQAFNEQYYFNFYEEYDIYSKFESKEEVDKNTVLMLDYLKGRNQLDTDFFNEKEKLHLEDVQDIIRNLIIISYISLALFLLTIIYFRHQRRYDYLSKGFFYGGILSLALIIIFLLTLVIDFKSVFLNFHKVFFDNDLWILNPATDNLINMFSNAFFYNITVKIITNMIIASLVFILVGYFSKKYIQKNKK